jgi:hypothetical protein
VTATAQDHRQDARPAAGRWARDPRAWSAAVVAGLAGLSGVVYLRDPMTRTVFPPCPLHEATGLWCPGCGATRASYQLFRGDVVEALHHNALWVVLAPLVVWQVGVWALRAWGVRARWLKTVPLGRPVVGAFLVALVAFTVVRNLPLDAVEVLNPRSS